MINQDDLEDGYYWIMREPGRPPEIAKFSNGRTWYLPGDRDGFRQVPRILSGPILPSPTVFWRMDPEEGPEPDAQF